MKKRAERESECPLDRTMIHPESYEIATKLINMIGVKPQNIGSENFLKKVQQFSLTSSK